MVIIFYLWHCAWSITIHYPCLTLRISLSPSLSLQSYLNCAVREAESNSEKSIYTRLPSLLSLFPFSSFPAHSHKHTRAHTNTHKLWSTATPRKQTGLWLEEPDRSWLAPTNPLSEPALHINNTNTTSPPHSSSIPPSPPSILCHQTPSLPPLPPPPFPPACTPPLLIFQNKTEKPPKRNCIKLRKW